MEQSLNKKLQEMDNNGQLGMYKAMISTAANAVYTTSNNADNGNFTLENNAGDLIEIDPNESSKYVNIPAQNPSHIIGDPIVTSGTTAQGVGLPPNWVVESNPNLATFDFGPQPTSGAELIGMLVEGKDLVENKDEFLEKILLLPSVKGDNLKAIEVYERLRKLAIVTSLVDVEVNDRTESKS